MHPARSSHFARRARVRRPMNSLSGGAISNPSPARFVLRPARLPWSSPCAPRLRVRRISPRANSRAASTSRFRTASPSASDDRDRRLIGTTNGGAATSVNSDDGNLNYDTGIVSNASKFIGELDFNYRNFGAFARVHGFFDFENENGEQGRAMNSRPKRRIWSEKISKSSISTSPARSTWAARRWI